MFDFADILTEIQDELCLLFFFIKILFFYEM